MGASKVLTILSVLVFTTYSYAGFLDSFVEGVKNIVKNSNNEMTCEDMLKNSPKQTITENYAKPAITGMLMGAIAGAAVDKEDRVRGAVIGAIVGTAGGFAYSRYQQKDVIVDLNFREKLIKKGVKIPYLELVDLRTTDDSFKDKNVFKKGDYIFLILKIHSVKDKPEEAVNVTYKYTLYRDGNLIANFYDSINLLQGEAIDYFAIPVCNQTLPGNYELEVQVENEFVKSKRSQVLEIRE